MTRLNSHRMVILMGGQRRARDVALLLVAGVAAVAVVFSAVSMAPRTPQVGLAFVVRAARPAARRRREVRVLRVGVAEWEERRQLQQQQYCYCHHFCYGVVLHPHLYHLRRHHKHMQYECWASAGRLVGHPENAYSKADVLELRAYVVAIFCLGRITVEQGRLVCLCSCACI